LGGEKPEKPAAHIDDVDIVLYQYAICPFCNKVKAVLDFYGLRYRTVEVNPLNKAELKDESAIQTDYRKVPLATIDGEIVTDSPVILRRVLSLLEDRGIATKTQGEGSGGSDEEWMQWVDKSLAVLLFPNITRNFPESWQAFSYIADVERFSVVQRGLNRVLGPVAMWAAQGKIKKKYDIDDERAALFDALYAWADAVDASASDFVGGDTPSVADLCVFGCIRAIDGLDTHTEVVTDPRIRTWYDAMVEAVGASSNLEKTGNAY
jgi:microsomal prostaglandin-E synthase 2